VRRIASLLLFVLAVGLFVASFFLPVADELPFRQEPFTGWAAFLTCFLLPFEGGLTRAGELLAQITQALMFAASLASFAMVCALCGWLVGKRRLAILGSLLAIALAAPIQVIGILESPSELLGPAYWVWCASFVILMVASLIVPASDIREFAPDYSGPARHRAA
jgi:hypothetical protein